MLIEETLLMVDKRLGYPLGMPLIKTTTRPKIRFDQNALWPCFIIIFSGRNVIDIGNRLRRDYLAVTSRQKMAGFIEYRTSQFLLVAIQ